MKIRYPLGGRLNLNYFCFPTILYIKHNMGFWLSKHNIFKRDVEKRIFLTLLRLKQNTYGNQKPVYTYHHRSSISYGSPRKSNRKDRGTVGHKQPWRDCQMWDRSRLDNPFCNIGRFRFDDTGYLLK